MKAKEILFALAQNPDQEMMPFGWFTECNDGTDYIDFFFANEPHTMLHDAVECGDYIYTWARIPKAHKYAEELVPTNVLSALGDEDIKIYLYKVED